MASLLYLFMAPNHLLGLNELKKEKKKKKLDKEILNISRLLPIYHPTPAKGGLHEAI